MVAGAGILVTGTGDELDPFTITATDDPSALNATDTPTVDMTALTTAEGIELSADVIVDPIGGLDTGPDGIRVRIDGTAPNALVEGPEGLRVVPGAVDLDPAGGLRSTTPGLGIKLDPVAGNEATVTSAGLRVATDFSAMTQRIDRLTHIARAAQIIYNQGAPKVNLTAVSWVNMIVIPPMEQQQSASYYNVAMPPAGTTITGMHGSANVQTVSIGGDTYIPLGDWQALWYLLPTGNTTNTSVSANLRRTSFGTNAARMPDNAILIAWRSGMEDKEVHWADGSISVPWRVAGDVLRQQQGGDTVSIGQAINLGTGGSQRCSYRRINHVWEVEAVYAWSGSGIGAPGGGSLYQAVDFAAPAYDTSRTQWDRTGTAAFWTADNGSAPNRGFKFEGISTMTPGQTRIYFEMPASTTAVYLERMRVWDGSGSSATAFPNVGRTLDTSGSRLEMSIRVPAGALPQV